MGANTRPRKPRRQNQLQLAEYICWVSSAVGTVVASTSMQFAYAGVPLSLSLLLNLANRRRIEVVTHQRAMGAVVRVQQQLSQDLVAIEQRLRQVAEHHPTETPTQSQLRLQQLHQLAQHTSDSQTRIRDLDDFRLVYQEIVSLQEQHRHVYESLAATIDYLNDSPLPQRVDEIEAAIAQIRRDFGLMNDRLAHSMPIDVTRHTQSDTQSNTQSDTLYDLSEDLSGGFDDLDHLRDHDNTDETQLAGDVLEQIFETERQREALDRRTITLPLEQFAVRPELESEVDDGIFDADILTVDSLDSLDSVNAVAQVSNADVAPEADSVIESMIESMPEVAATIGETRDRLGAPETEPQPRTHRPTIDLFSPNATPPVETEPAPNAIPPLDLNPASIEPNAPVTPDPLLELTRSAAATVSFALTTPNARPANRPKTPSNPAADRVSNPSPDLASKTSGVNLPTIDAGAISPIAPIIPRPSDSPPAPSAPPQDWQRLSTLTDHGDWVSDLAINSTGEMLISASFDRTIQFWDIQSGESLNILSEHSSPVCAIALSRDQGWLVSGSWDRTIKIWDLETQSLLETLVDDSGVAGSVRSLAVSPNGRFIASGWFDRTIAIWDVRITPKRRKVSVSACGSQLAHGGRVDAIAFDPTGQLLASASADGTVKLWSVDGNTGELELLKTLSDSADPINAVTFSRDGMALIEANRDRIIRIWNVETGEQLHKLTGHNSSVTALAAHPDGETLISGSSDGTVRLWHLPTGQPIATLSGSRDAVMSVAVSDDGRILVSGSADGSIDVWRRWGMAELPM